MSDEIEIKKQEDESELTEDQLDETAGGVQVEASGDTIVEYGTIVMEFKAEPKSKDWIKRLKDQYDG